MTSKKIDTAEIAARARNIRRLIIEMLAAAGSGHPGGSLSATDLVACLYFGVMRHRPPEPFWEDRDRFILSKGHACPVLYAALAEAGYITHDLLSSLRRFGSPLQGHPDRRKLGLIEASTGSLGIGLSLGIGMALAARLRGSPSRTYVLLGDGECEEGQIWEAAMYAPHLKLGSLCAIVDFNRLQLDATVEEITDLQPLADKWRSFNWHVLEIDGHDYAQILDAFARAEQVTDRPTVIVAATVKGKGVSYMENQLKFHGSVPDKPEDIAKALAELGAGARS
ncbi:MAG TPA: transketolase [Methylomirabilota bacterium]|jgi:transketolase|nr:transketolase [Methylomirabilota bacterium]